MTVLNERVKPRSEDFFRWFSMNAGGKVSKTHWREVIVRNHTADPVGFIYHFHERRIDKRLFFKIQHNRFGENRSGPELGWCNTASIIPMGAA